LRRSASYETAIVNGETNFDPVRLESNDLNATTLLFPVGHVKAGNSSVGEGWMSS
jgi:hypothetical protein